MSGFSDLLDVVEHLVSTHPFWNQKMSQVEAVAKVASARADATAGVVASDVPDLTKLIQDVEEIKNKVEGK